MRVYFVCENSDMKFHSRRRSCISFMSIKKTVLKKIDSSLTATNPFVHSICVYNNYYKTFYSAYNSLFFHDVSLEETLKEYKDIPKIKSVWRRIPNPQKGTYDNVFTYFMYNDTDKVNYFNEAVVVNVYEDYLLQDNIF